MTKQNPSAPHTSSPKAPESDPVEAIPAESRATSERPRVRRLGRLPEVTTAFGGSFVP